MSLQKKKPNHLNKQVIQKIIAFQLKEKKHNEIPIILERNSPKNDFYLPNMPFSKNTPIKNNNIHHINKSVDSSPNFRIISKKTSNIQMKSSEKGVFQQMMIELDVKSSKNANFPTNNEFSSQKPKEFSVEVVLSNEKTITVLMKDFEEKTIKTLKRKILAEINDFEEEENFKKIIAFKTVKKLYLIDFVMNSDSHSLNFFEKSEKLRFTPFYKESALNLVFLLKFLNFLLIFTIKSLRKEEKSKGF